LVPGWHGRRRFSWADIQDSTAWHSRSNFRRASRASPPNLDVVASRADVVIAVESKCIEYLGMHKATFQPSYDVAVDELAHESWEGVRSHTALPFLGAGECVRLDALRAHRRDLRRLAERVADPTVEFAAMSYPELWAQWAALDAPEWLAIHVAALRERYAVSLSVA
jgi:hypothetical protein